MPGAGRRGHGRCLEVVTLDAAHELSRRASGIVTAVSTPEELERIGDEELRHTPAENRSPLGMPAL